MARDVEMLEMEFEKFNSRYIAEVGCVLLGEG